LTITRPALGASKPAIDMSNVVLPHPDGPTKKRTHLLSTLQVMSPIATVVSPPACR
jgi:hypothetical protein